jgi:hypothetical protein
MPTSAEAARLAQEDAMMRQIAMQAAAQRQRQQEMSQMQAGRAQAESTAERIARMQIEAEDRRQGSLAAREEAANKALMDRQLALVAAGKQMSEAEKAQHDMAREDRAGDYKAAIGQEIAKAIRGNQPASGFVGSSYATKTKDAAMAEPAPQRSPAYDMTGFNADVAGIADNARVARNESDGLLSYDDLPTYTPGKQGAFVRDPTGTLRQVHFPEASSSKTANKAAVEALKAQLMPESPIPGVTGAGAAATMPPAVPAATASDPVDRALKLARSFGMAPEDSELVRKRSREDASYTAQIAAIQNDVALTPAEKASAIAAVAAGKEIPRTGVFDPAKVRNRAQIQALAAPHIDKARSFLKDNTWSISDADKTQVQRYLQAMVDDIYQSGGDYETQKAAINMAVQQLIDQIESGRGTFGTAGADDLVQSLESRRLR